jgi:hypothetical protein
MSAETLPRSGSQPVIAAPVPSPATMQITCSRFQPHSYAQHPTLGPLGRFR